MFGGNTGGLFGASSGGGGSSASSLFGGGSGGGQAAIGAGSGSLFGGAPAASSGTSSLFGSAAPGSDGGGLFGSGGASTGGSLFGSGGAAASGSFGATSGGSLFGAAGSSGGGSASSLFGAGSSGAPSSGIFGAASGGSSSSTSLFGAPSGGASSGGSLFGASSGGGGLFGASTGGASSGGLFGGAASSSSLFGAPSAGGAFGAASGGGASAGSELQQARATVVEHRKVSDLLRMWEERIHKQAQHFDAFSEQVLRLDTDLIANAAKVKVLREEHAQLKGRQELVDRSLQQIWEQQDSLGLLLSGLVEALRPQQADEAAGSGAAPIRSHQRALALTLQLDELERQAEDLARETGKIQSNIYKEPLTTVVRVLDAHASALDALSGQVTSVTQRIQVIEGAL